MKKLFKILLCLALTVPALTLAIPAPSSDGIEVQAEGLGRNSTEAMIAAKRAAVEQGIGTVIQSETEIKNFQVSKDVVLTKTMGAVKSVTKLSEETGPEATIEALLSVIPYFRISPVRAKEILIRMEHALSRWREAGLALGMTDRELDQFAEAFEHPERGAARRAATRVD